MSAPHATSTQQAHDWSFAVRLVGAGACLFALLLIANTFSALDLGRNTEDWTVYDEKLRRALPVGLLGIVALLSVRRPAWSWVWASVTATALMGAVIARTVGTDSGLPGL